MPEKTLFQKIADGEIPADFVHQDDRCVAFRDISPAAPAHVLVVPRKPIASPAAIGPEDAALIGHLFVVARQIAEQEGLAPTASDPTTGEGGYRLVFNCGTAAGQSVPHLHLHLLGGRSLSWPPG